MSSDRRVPYFERPRPSHDWRWWVGIIGRGFITIGVLMFAFVAYQLWGTGIQTAQAQHTLDRQFEQRLGTSTTISTSTTTVTSTTPTSTTGASTTVTSTTAIPVAPAGPAPARGSAVARIKIPSINLTYTVVEGVGVPDLKKGPGHFPETPMPGQLGNAAIAGHRTTYGHPFYNLDKVHVGDHIEVDTFAGTYIYAVTGTSVVSPSQYTEVIPTSDPHVATLTLATCTPAYTARQRLIIKATLIVEDSSQVFAPPSATVTTQPVVPETIPGDTDPATTTGAASTTPTTTNTTATTTTVSAPTGAGDAFASGWFDDGGAIVPSIFWGIVLAMVAYGAFRVAKRFNRLWVAPLAGAIPFIVVLYFFFENVNRLLPSSI